MNFILIMDLYLSVILIILTIKLIMFLVKKIKKEMEYDTKRMPYHERVKPVTEIYGKTIKAENAPIILLWSTLIMSVPVVVFIFIVALFNSH